MTSPAGCGAAGECAGGRQCEVLAARVPGRTGLVYCKQARAPRRPWTSWRAGVDAVDVTAACWPGCARSTRGCRPTDGLGRPGRCRCGVMGSDVLTLRRPATACDGPRPRPGQQAVVDWRGTVLRVLGGPGTGKTTVAVELVVRAVQDGVPADAVPRSSPPPATRAARLRDRSRPGSAAPRPSRWPGPSSRSGSACCAGRRPGGRPPPRLISGPEQDVVLGELLAGHAAGDGGAALARRESCRALPTRASAPSCATC